MGVMRLNFCTLIESEVQWSRLEETKEWTSFFAGKSSVSDMRHMRTRCCCGPLTGCGPFIGCGPLAGLHSMSLSCASHVVVVVAVY